MPPPSKRPPVRAAGHNRGIGIWAVLAGVVDRHRRGQSAYPAPDVDARHLASVQIDRLLDALEHDVTLTQSSAQRRADRLLQHGMADQVVGRQRLLDGGAEKSRTSP